MFLNPYDILEIDTNASQQEIQNKYNELLFEYTNSSDINKDEKINLLNMAYDALISHDIYREVRAFIENKNFVGAQAKLNIINDRTNAEWNYLQGFIAVQKGWFESGINYLKKAVELDPDNPEYVNSLNTLQARVFDYASRYINRGIRHNVPNNMNGCGGGNNNGGMC